MLLQNKKAPVTLNLLESREKPQRKEKRGKTYLTEKNSVVSPNFLMWKFCRKTQFLHSFGRFTRNYAETVTLQKISTPGNQVKLQSFLWCLIQKLLNLYQHIAIFLAMIINKIQRICVYFLWVNHLVNYQKFYQQIYISLKYLVWNFYMLMQNLRIKIVNLLHASSIYIKDCVTFADCISEINHTKKVILRS